MTTRFLLGLIKLTVLGSCSQEVRLDYLLPSATVVAFGDSLTAGKGVANNQSYPALLGIQLQRRVINSGVSGELSAQGRRRLEDVLDEFHPQLLILCHAGNDLIRGSGTDRAKENILAMIAMAHEKNVQVVLLGVPQPGLFLGTAQFYSEIAQQTAVAYIPDLIAEVLSTPSLKSDLAHPNAAGYELIATTIANFLRDAAAI